MLPKDPGQVSISPVSMEPNPAHTEQVELRLEKIGTRVTMLAIIIPVLLIVVSTIAYLDIKRRVISAEDTGTTGVQSVSKHLESRFSSVSIQLADLDKRLEAAIKSQAENINGIKKRLHETEKSQIWLKTITATKKEMDSRLSETATAIRDDLAVLQKDVVTADQNLNAFHETVKKELADMAGLLERYDTQLLSLQADLTTVNADKADRVTMAQEMAKVRSELQAELKQTRSTLESLIRINQERIAKLTPGARTASKPKAASTDKPAAAPSVPAKPKPTPAPAPPTPTAPKPAPSAATAAPRLAPSSTIIEKTIE